MHTLFFFQWLQASFVLSKPAQVAKSLEVHFSNNKLWHKGEPMPYFSHLFLFHRLPVCSWFVSALTYNFKFRIDFSPWKCGNKQPYPSESNSLAPSLNSHKCATDVASWMADKENASRITQLSFSWLKNTYWTKLGCWYIQASCFNALCMYHLSDLLHSC